MSHLLPRASRAKSPKKQEGKAGARDGGRSAKQEAEAAQYIAEFTAELSFLARRRNLDLLAYLLDMARLEAIRTVQARHEDP